MAIQRLISFEATADVHGFLRRIRYDGEAKTLTVESVSVDEAATIVDALSTGGVKSARAGSLPVSPATPEGEAGVMSKAADEPQPPAQPEQGVAAGTPPTTTAAGESGGESPPSKATSGKGKGKASGGGKGKGKATSGKGKKAADEPPPAAPGANGQGEGGKVLQMDGKGEIQEREPGSPEVDQTPPEQQGEDWVSLGREEQELQQAEQAKQAEKAKADQAPTEGLPEELTGAKKIRDVVTYIYDTEGIQDPDAIQRRCLAIKDNVKVLARAANLEDRLRRTLDIMGLSEASA